MFKNIKLVVLKGKSKSKKQNYLGLSASENILGKPGHQDLEGGHWSCYSILNPNPSAQGGCRF